MKPLILKITTETNKATGDLVAVYFYVREGKSAEIREYADGRAFADYNRQGELLGVELLAPCEITVLDRIARREPKPVKRFLRSAIPLEMAVV
jgi:hypothetical protein